MTVPSLELDAVTAAPTVSDGSVRRCVSETTSDGLARRLDVDPGAEPLAADHVVADPDHHAVDGCVDVRAGRGAHVEDGVRRPVAAELVPGEARLVAAREPAHEAREQSLVRLLADRLERQRAVVDRVVADRGDALLGDRHAQLERVVHRDDLRLRRPGREQPLRRSGRCRDRLRRRPPPERRQQQRDDDRRADEDECRDPPRTVLSGRAAPTGAARLYHCPAGRHRADTNGRAFALQLYCL